MSDEDQLRAAILWHEYRVLCGLTGPPNLIDTEDKAEFFMMVGYKGVALMIRHANHIGAKY